MGKSESNYCSYRKEQISFTVLCDQILYFQTLQGLLETVIGLDLSGIPDEYKDKLYEIFGSVDSFTAIPIVTITVTMLPSIVVALLTCRLGVLWLLNVLFLICVPVSVCQIPNKRGKREHLTTYPHKEPRNRGFHNNSYIEEPHSKEPGPKHDYSDENIYSKSHSYTGDDVKRSSTPPPQTLTNMAPASSIAVSGPNMHSPASQPDYPEFLHPQYRYHKPSTPGENYELQALNRMPVTSDHGTNEQIRAPHLRWTDSEISSQPSIKNRPAENIALTRVDLPSSAPGTVSEYLGPRQGLHSSLSSNDNYKLPPLSTQSVPHDVMGNNGPDGQRKAPQLHWTDSGRPPYRPPASTTNLQRTPASPVEVDRPQNHSRNAGRNSSLSPDVLRGQLPWSYFGRRKAPMKPKPIQESVAEGKLKKPYIPDPDYTWSFRKTARPVVSKWSEDGTSFADSVASHRATSASGVDRSSLLESNRH